VTLMEIISKGRDDISPTVSIQMRSGRCCLSKAEGQP
jgi:hypothetical protein